MIVRDLEEEGWTMTFTDGSGLGSKAAGIFCSNPNRLDKDRQPDRSGDQYLGIKVTHFDGELALEGHNDTNMDTVALLSDYKPAIRVVEKVDSRTEAPRPAIEARIQLALET